MIYTQETKWGFANSQITLVNPGYVTAYDYGIMQPRYILQEISRVEQLIEYERIDSFREDDRIPESFRQQLEHYTGSGYDRGHLAPSADLRTQDENSASFLLTNMSPQLGRFNRGVWKELEALIRDEAIKNHKAWCMSGPLWYPDHNISCLTAEGLRPVPIPNGFFKSVVYETERGKISGKHWVVDHSEDAKAVRVPLQRLEWISGLQLWSGVHSREKIAG